MTRSAPRDRPRPTRAPRPREPKPRRRIDAITLALAVLLIATFVLRLWGIKQGLPYIYNVDEESHFVPKAITFFSHDLNPYYFLNPPAYSYALNVVFEFWFGSSDAVARAYTNNPTEVFVVARVLASVLGTLSVWLTYLTGKRLFGRGGGADRRGHLRPRLPAHLLQPPGAQRRPHPRSGHALALRHLGRPAEGAPG